MTDSTIALIERLEEQSKSVDMFRDQIRAMCAEAATELTTLLQRCEKAEAEIERPQDDRHYWFKRANAQQIRAELAERQRDEALKAAEQTKEECADFVKHWLIESDNEYAVEVAVECSHALLEWDGKS